MKGKRRLVGAVLVVLLPATPGAAAEADLRERLAECREIPGVVRRLDCYDRLALAAAADSVEPAPDERRAARPGAPEPSEADRFGRGTERRTEPEPLVDSVTAILAGLEQRPRGEYVFVLDNGQTWTELSPGRARYEEGASVQIRRTRLGGHMLSIDGGRATRVRRVD